MIKLKKEIGNMPKSSEAKCHARWLNVDLLGSLRKSHASKGGRKRFRIHFAPCALEIVVLPRLHIW